MNTRRLVSALFVSAFIGPGVSYGYLYLFHLIALPAVFLLLYSIIASKKVLSIPKNGWKFFLLFFAWYSVSILWSPNKVYSLVYITYIAFGGFIMFAALYWVNDFNKQVRVFKAITWVALADILFSLLEVFTQFRLPVSLFSRWLSLFGRADQGKLTDAAYFNSMPTGFHWNPNNLAGVMVMILPFFLFSRKKWVRFSGGIIVLILVLAAGSRGGLIAYILTLILWGIMYSPKGTLKFVFVYAPLCVFMIALILSFPQVRNNEKVAEALSTFDAIKSYIAFDQTLNYSGDSISIRKYLISRGITELKNSYGRGIGGGASKYLFEQESSKITSMHNFWIELLTEGGILAGGGFIIWYFGIIIKLYSLYHRAKRKSSVYEIYLVKYFSGTLATSMTGYAIAAVSASSVIYVLPMWIMIGIALATINNSKKVLNSSDCQAFFARSNSPKGVEDIFPETF